MARNYRDSFENGSFYHIYNKVVSEVTLFKADQDYLDFLNRYIKYFSPYFDTYVYCLIPNHFHFLISVKEEKQIKEVIFKEDTNAAKKYLSGEESLNFFIENQLGRMLSGVALKYNKTHKRAGPLFKTGTKRVELNTESRIIYQLCYIHHNPIHHNLSATYNTWKYSSYLAYTTNQVSKIDKDFMIDLIGGTDVFHTLHDEFKILQKENLFNE